MALRDWWHARVAGDAMYKLPGNEAIKAFVANHNDSAGRQGIIEYMAEMYDTDEATTRMWLSKLTAGGELTQLGDSYVSVLNDPYAGE